MAGTFSCRWERSLEQGPAWWEAAIEACRAHGELFGKTDRYTAGPSQAASITRTTGMACAYESRRFIGIERDIEYLPIATRRIAHAQRLVGRPVDPS